MLFDLRGRGRRRVVKFIYGGLAILLGGGLVFFGIGGDVQGGLFDAFSQNNGDASKQIQERVENAEKATTRDPRNARNYAVLAEARFQLAGQSEGYNPNAQSADQQFTGEAREALEASAEAWKRHLELAGDRPNTNTAAIMRNAMSSLGDDEGAVRAQEIVIDGLQDPGFGDYAQLAFLAYQAGQTRKGDLASDRAQELAPKDQRAAIKQSLDQAKSAGAQAAAGGEPGAAPGGATPPQGTSTTGG